MSVLFFTASPPQPPPHTIALEPRYRAELWRPSLLQTRPDGVPGRSAVAWWIMHQLRFFGNREYGQLVIRDADGTVVHRSGLFPAWPRFPFMARGDLQVGDTWTHPDHRGRSLAAFAIEEVLVQKARPGRTFWYLTDAGNAASIRAAEKAGMVLAGEGERVPRLGSRLLGAFILTTPLTMNPRSLS